MLNRPGVEPQILTEIATLGSIAAATGRARTSHEVAAYALEILRRSSAADTGVVLFDDGDGLDVEAAYGFPDGAVEAILNDTSMSPQLLASMERATAPMYAPVASAAMRPDVARQLSEAGITHVLIAPLRTAGRVAGLMGLGWRGEPAVAPPEATLLHATVVIGPSLENAHLVERLQRSLAAERRLADEQATLQSLTLIAEKAGAFEELAATTIGQIVPLVDAAAGSYAPDRRRGARSYGVDGRARQLHRPRPRRRRKHDDAGSPPSQRGRGVRPVLRGGRRAAAEPGLGARTGLHGLRGSPGSRGGPLEALMMLWFRRPLTAPNEISELSACSTGSAASPDLAGELPAARTPSGVGVTLPAALRGVARRDPPPQADRRGDRRQSRRPPPLPHRPRRPAGVRREREDPHVAEERKRRVETIEKEGRGVFRDVGIRPDGTEFPEEVAVVRIDIGGETRKLLIVRDLTNRPDCSRSCSRPRRWRRSASSSRAWPTS
jgi:hypothetical protein